jgi:thioredoxin-like negative regulator of GroEL
MHANGKWILKTLLTISINLVVVSSAGAQITVVPTRAQSVFAADEAREIFNAGQRSYDEYRFTDAESKFREVVTRFPKNAIADRADYYLIRTLAQLGKRNEAIQRINLFSNQYPKSKWLDDVQELRIQLTNQVPPRAEAILLASFTNVPAPPLPAPNPPPPFVAPRVFTSPVNAPANGPQTFAFHIQGADFEVSLQQEIMRVIFQSDVQRAFQIVGERLKMNPADPVVLSSLNLVAAVPTTQAISMLSSIVKNPPNAKARRDAIFWMSQSKADKDATVDTLLGIAPSLSDDDSEALAYSLSQIGTEKAANALAAMANDKSKTEKVRINAVLWMAQTRTVNRVALLDTVYKSNMDNSRLRQQALFALNQTRDPQALSIVSNIASSDPDSEIRRQAAFFSGHNNFPRK